MKRMYINSPIFAMSVAKSVGEKQIRGQAEVIQEHTAKLALYSEFSPQDINGWKNTIARCFSKISSITLKPKGRRFDAESYYELVLDFFGEDSKDIRNALIYWETKLSRLQNDPYPDIEVSTESVYLCESYVETYIEFCNMISDSKEDIPFQVFRDML